jgi:Zn-finger protein
MHHKSHILCVSDSIGEKGYTCQKCGISRDEEEVKKMTREILLLSDKASSFVSSGSILYLAVHD